MKSVKKFKKTTENCIFCGESNKSVLDVHRILEGCNGGEYTMDNTIIACANCHRKIHHTDEIKIDGWFMSTSGPVLHCWVGGIEQYLPRRYY